MSRSSRTSQQYSKKTEADQPVLDPLLDPPVPSIGVLLDRPLDHNPDTAREMIDLVAQEPGPKP